MPYSSFPVTVDGVSLDSVAWNIEAKTRTIAGLRSADLAVPGVDGEIASLNDDLEATLFTLNMWVVGVNSSGLIPLGSGMAQVRDNVDQLNFLFKKRHALLDVREVMDGGTTVRQFYGKVVDSLAPEIRAGGIGKFAVNIKNPAGMWQDLDFSDWSQSSIASNTTYEVLTMRGATEHTTDGIIVVTGPIANPKITDFGSGAYVQLNATLAAGQSWRINNATWATRYGSGLTVGSTDATGTDAQAITQFGGGYRQFLRLVPTLTSGFRKVQLTVTGTGLTSTTALSVRARRKFGQ